jgi:hypothetical protein
MKLIGRTVEFRMFQIYIPQTSRGLSVKEEERKHGFNNFLFACVICLCEYLQHCHLQFMEGGGGGGKGGSMTVKKMLATIVTGGSGGSNGIYHPPPLPPWRQQRWCVVVVREVLLRLKRGNLQPAFNIADIWTFAPHNIWLCRMLPSQPDRSSIKK